MVENFVGDNELKREFNRELFDRNLSTMIYILDDLPEKFDLNSAIKFHRSLVLMEGSVQQILMSIVSQDNNPNFESALINFKRDSFYDIGISLESIPGDASFTKLKELVELFKEKLSRLKEVSNVEYNVRNQVAKLSGLLRVVTQFVEALI